MVTIYKLLYEVRKRQFLSFVDFFLSELTGNTTNMNLFWITCQDDMKCFQYV
jgi:hypothetical protein